jgi:hypothetical protein
VSTEVSTTQGEPLQQLVRQWADAKGRPRPDPSARPKTGERPCFATRASPRFGTLTTIERGWLASYPERVKAISILILGLAFLAAPSAQAKTVRSQVALAPTGTCMISAAGGIGCFGDAVPASYTDGYLWLRKRGKALIREAGGLLAPVTSRPVRLRNGDRWVKRGIKCRWQRGRLTCRNRSGHGFWLTKRAYRVLPPAAPMVGVRLPDADRH